MNVTAVLTDDNYDQKKFNLGQNHIFHDVYENYKTSYSIYKNL